MGIKEMIEKNYPYRPFYVQGLYILPRECAYMEMIIAKIIMGDENLFIKKRNIKNVDFFKERINQLGLPLKNTSDSFHILLPKITLYDDLDETERYLWGILNLIWYVNSIGKSHIVVAKKHLTDAIIKESLIFLGYRIDGMRVFWR